MLANTHKLAHVKKTCKVGCYRLCRPLLFSPPKVGGRPRGGQRDYIRSLPHEPFAEYQLFADEASPFTHALVFAYTNGMESYVATKRELELGVRGGYEASPLGHAASSMHRLPPHPSAEQLIQEGIVRLLNELKST